MKLTSKQVFVLLGAGLIASGLVTIAFIYQGLSSSDMFGYQPTSMNETASSGEEKFNLEKIHSVPLVRHDHVTLAILVNGHPMVIPDGVGMYSDFWHDHSLDRYGPSGISPLHTHDNSGTIHIESTAQKEFTVGNFLNVMGLKPDKVIKMTVDGSVVDDDPLDYEMKRGQKIQLEIAVTGQ